jgi:hypothetical protein
VHDDRSPKYYDGSKLSAPAARARRWAHPFPLLALALFALGCGASNSQVAKSARRIPVAHFATLPPAERATALSSLPVVLEIRKGDTFPVEALLESSLLELHTEGAWAVIARETFYVLLREEGPPAVSLDGVDFETPAKGSFNVGVDAKPEQPTKVRLALSWHAAQPDGAR